MDSLYLNAAPTATAIEMRRTARSTSVPTDDGRHRRFEPESNVWQLSVVFMVILFYHF